MMRGIRTIQRYIRDAAKSVVRNFSLSLASISCIAITLVVVAFSIIISYNVENFTESIRKDVTMVIFLDKDAKGDDYSRIEAAIRATGNVEKLTFKSKQESAEETAKGNEVFETIINQWTEETNPLLDSFELKVRDVEVIKETAKQIGKIDKVNTVSYGEDMVDQLITIFDVVKKVSIGAVVALIVVTAFLIANTIKLAIYARKREIEIMRLVGASNISIKIPFVIEGLFLGLLGSIIPIVITIYGYTSLYDFFGGKLFSSTLAKLIDPNPFVYLASLLLMVIGILVGMFGSWRAVKKYLKI
ncbi:MAG: permease-like cell division protein FtsX [Erysipelotrichaceae bacterium]|nr:permease-like cell division protein FtsX [Erysipelotrichaceae bacterium]